MTLDPHRRTERPQWSRLREVLNVGATLDWHDQAACRGLDPDMFFPERGDSGAEAKGVCEGCPVRLDCLEWALETNQIAGVWGGLAVDARNRESRARRKRAR
jgi:WhiB family redox-sensing transcriptional regulator